MRLRVLLFLSLWSLPILAQQGFVRNAGQWDDPSVFAFRNGANAVFFTPDSLVFSLLSPDDFDPDHDHHRHHYAEVLHYVNFSLTFPGGRTLNWQGESPHTHYSNFFVGDRSRWRSRVPSYGRLRARDVYPGVDLVVYATADGIKYDWELQPGISPEVIRQRYRGIDDLKVGRRQLKLQTAIGTLKEDLPYAHQRGREVSVDFVARAPREIGFEASALDPSLSLVIDPVYVFSTFSGSTADNFGYTATFDSAGNGYGGGVAFGAGYPTTLGAVDLTFGGGLFDASISKFSADGTQLLWSTYFGGLEQDQPHSMEVDENDNLYVFGITGSADFTTTPGAFDTTFDGGAMTAPQFFQFPSGIDLFVTAFTSAGDSLIGSTFLGGPANEGANSALIHNYGDAFRGEIELQYGGGGVLVVSSADSAGYPITPSGHGHIGGQDGVITVLNRDLTGLLYSTYAGTSGDDALYSLALTEKSGNANHSSRLFLAGATSTTSGVFFLGQDSLNITTGGGQNGLLVAAFLDTAMTLLAAQASGLTGYDQHFFVEPHSQSDTTSTITVVGQSKSGLQASDPNFYGQPGSAQYFQQYRYNPSSQGFDLLRTSVWGDGQNSAVNVSPTALLVDDCGNLYFSGWGGSPNFEGSTDNLYTTPDALQSQTDGRDFYFLVLDPSWRDVRMATYFGSSGREHVDGGTSRFDRQGRIFQAICAGCGGNSDLPTFPSNAYSTTNNSFNCNLAVTVIDMDLRNAHVKVTPDPMAFCADKALNLIDSSQNVQEFWIDYGNGDTAILYDQLSGYVYDSVGIFDITIIGLDTICDTWDTTVVSVQTLPAYDSVFVTLEYDPCDPDRLVQASVRRVKDSTLVVDDPVRWNVAGANFSGPSVVVTVPLFGANRIEVVVEDTVCGVLEQLVDTAFFRAQPFVTALIDYDTCSTNPPIYRAVSNPSYQVFEWYMSGQLVQSGTSLTDTTYGTAEVYFIALDTLCGASDTLAIDFDVPTQASLFPSNVITPNGDGVNDFWELNAAGNWSEFHVILYTRWGTKVFETNVPTFQWGADFKGEILSPGVYFYQIEGLSDCGAIREEGTLHITY